MAENVTTKFRVDISDLKKNIAEADQQVKLYRAELVNASAGMKKGKETADSLTKKIETQSKIVETEKAKLQALKEELARYESKVTEGKGIIDDLTKKHEAAARAFGEDSEEAQKLAGQLKEAQAAQERNTKAADDLRVKVINQDTAVKNAEGQVKQFNTALDNMSTKEQKTDNETDKFTKGSLNAFTVALGNLATNVITAVINKIGDLGKSMFDAFQNFDDGRDNLIKATGAVGDAASELTEVYANVSKNVSGDLSKIGSAVGEVNTRLGYTGDQLQDATESFMKFADITGTDAVTAVQMVSRAMGDAGIDADQYAEILDQIAVAAQASGISVDKLTEYLTKYGAPMRALGFDTKSSISIFSQWEKAGVNTETAFSGMKTAISKWSKEGLDARKEFQKTLDEIGKMPNIAEATTKAIEVFGQKAGPDLADAIQGGRFAYADFLKIVENSAGTVENTYEATQSGLDRIKIAAQGFQVSLGEIGAKLVDAVAPGLENILAALTNFLTGEGTVDDIADQVKMLIQSAMEKAADKLPDFKDFLSRIGGQLFDEAVHVLPKFIMKLGDLFGDVVDQLYYGTSDESAAKVTRFILGLLPPIVDALAYLAQKVVWSLPKIIRILWDGLKGALDPLAEMLADKWIETESFFSGAWDSLSKRFKEAGTAAGEAVGSAFKGAINGILAFIEEKLGFLPKMVNGAIDFLNNIPGVKLQPMDPITLPRLAKGGIVDTSTIAQIGENGREAILPLENNTAGMREIAKLIAGEMRSAAPAGTSVALTQNISSPKALSRYEIMRQTKNMLELFRTQRR